MSDSEGAKSPTSEISADCAETTLSVAEVIARMQRAADTLSTEIEKPAGKELEPEVAEAAIVEAAPAPKADASDDRATVEPTPKPAAATVAEKREPEAAPAKTAAVPAPKIQIVAPAAPAPVATPDKADMIAAEDQKISMRAGKAAALRAQNAGDAKRAGIFAAHGWGRAAAGATLVVALSGAAFLGLRDGADVRPVVSAERAQPARPTPEQILAAETQDLRKQVQALTHEMQTLRATLQKQADETRTIQAHATAAAATIGQTTMRLDRIERDATSKFDKQASRVERLERLAADPVVTSTVEKSVAHAAPKKPDAPQAAEAALTGADYVLRSVRNGVAVVQTRRGMIEVAPGDTIPGVGRVRAIEKIDGRWVVVTRDGVIDGD